MGLPQASQLRHFVLRRSQVLRGVGADLRNYFFRIDNGEAALPHYVVEEPVSREGFRLFGCPDRRPDVLFGVGDGRPQRARCGTESP